MVHLEAEYYQAMATPPEILWTFLTGKSLDRLLIMVMTYGKKMAAIVQEFRTVMMTIRRTVP
jgi:hypothetical protein